MDDKTSNQAGPTGSPSEERAVSDELRELGRAFSSLSRTVFEEGRVLSVELLKSAREALDRARTEIERISRERR